MNPPSDTVEVAVAAGVDGTFHYRVPSHLLEQVLPGKRLLVPFGRRRIVGYALAFSASPVEDLREVIEVLDPEPLLSPGELDFLRWSASYYLHPLGDVLKSALPAGINPTDASSTPEPRTRARTEKFYIPAPGDPVFAAPAKKEREVFHALAAAGGLSAAGLRESFGSCGTQLRRLAEKGLVRVEEREVYRSPWRDPEPVREDPHPLNHHQKKAVDRIEEAVLSGKFSPFLLRGVTGSGKTEVYMQAIDFVLSHGKRALVLVPEISLTPQLVGRFRRRFSCGIAVLHSGLSSGERYDEWRRIRRGEADVVIGARSAVFAPVERLGIIIVDEEHEASYKQAEGFRYNARDLALVRGQRERSVVVLGTATPMLTTLHGVTEGKLGLLELPQRVRAAVFPTVEIVDMRGRREILSQELLEEVSTNLARGGQALLFLNRRGFATYIVCRGCGAPLRCPNCSVTLTFHKSRGRSCCHYCDYSVPSPTLCPACGGETGLLGLGTERVEEELRELFPDASIARMDRDTTSGKDSHARILKGLEQGETDILIGTQMIAKGHDFPGVTLVGVVSADGTLHLPDYRSAERTFQLLTQVIGRAGRGNLPGKVVVQTLAADHYAISSALCHAPEEFYEKEMEFRRELSYPPFSHLVAVHFSGNTEERVRKGAEQARSLLEALRREWRMRIEILGPAPSPLSKMRGKYRWQLLLKGALRRELHGILARWKVEFDPPSGVKVHVDVDPVEML